MKFLHTSDWHIGRNLFEFSLLPDQEYILEQIGSVIAQEKVDAVLISGDLYDRSLPSAQAVGLLDETFTDFISRFQIPILAVSGNHDSARRVAYASRLLEKSGLYLSGGFEPRLRKVTLQDGFGSVNFFLLPYFLPQQVRFAYQDSEIRTASQAFQKIIEQNADEIDPGERNILLAHGFFIKQNTEQPEISGSESSVGASDLTDLSCADCFDYVALGHLHSAQRAGSDKMRYSGSPLKYSVDEAKSKKSVTVVELKEKGNLEIKTVPLTPRRDLRVIEGSMEELCKPELASDDYIFARILSQGPVLNAMSRLREIYPHTLGLVFPQCMPTPTKALSPHLADAPADLLFEQFYHQVTQEEPDQTQMEVVRELLHDLKQTLL